jgi:hypothetical protein
LGGGAAEGRGRDGRAGGACVSGADDTDTHTRRCSAPRSVKLPTARPDPQEKVPTSNFPLKSRNFWLLMVLMGDV